MSVQSSHRRIAPAFAIAGAWVIGIVGLGAALVGAYLALAPENGVLTLFTESWAVRELRDVWPQALLISGGLAAMAGPGLALLAERPAQVRPGLTIAAVILAVCGAVAVGAGILVVA